MGDRANFGIRQHDGNTIYVYGHWAGHQMLARFASALHAATPRIIDGDSFYANRIIICNLIGEDFEGTLGWGISVNNMVAPDHKIPVYDFASDTVTLYDFDLLTCQPTDTIVTFTRDKFITRHAKIGV